MENVNRPSLQKEGRLNLVINFVEIVNRPSLQKEGRLNLVNDCGARFSGLKVEGSGY